MPDRPTERARQFIQAAPVLHVRDVQATVAFYRDRLGFNNDYGDATYAVVWRENAAVHFVRGDGETQGVDVFFWVEDVDSYCDEVRGFGAPIATEPRTQLYGIREFAVDDPNGVRLIFGMDAD